MSYSRNQRQAHIDTWLGSHRAELQTQPPTAIALQMRRAGLYSEKTSLTDIRCALRRRCTQLGLPSHDRSYTEQVAG
ncbi:MAG TPA: hypothetical protein VGM54_02175 [Chthoniobacter sp.]|jgi:hypothetical protein